MTKMEVTDRPEDGSQLEDDVLEDRYFFGRADKRVAKGGDAGRRERRVESVVAELRRRKALGEHDPGGSVEMKISRLRNVAAARRKKRRNESLLNRGAVVGEIVTSTAELCNPLQFPVFVNSVAAVAALDGTLCTALEEGEGECPVDFLPADDLTLVASSSQTVTVQVIVRKPGELQFLGLTWSFTIGTGPVSPKPATNCGPQWPQVSAF